jgi:hypothetical protein
MIVLLTQQYFPDFQAGARAYCPSIANNIQCPQPTKARHSIKTQIKDLVSKGAHSLQSARELRGEASPI